MEQKLFYDLSPESREETIREMAIKSENMVFAKPLTEEEMDFHYKELGNTAIRKDATEKELEEVKEDFKNRIAPLKNKMTEHMKAIRTKSIEIEGEVFAIADQETKMVGWYDVEGNLISSRRALPEELGSMSIHRQFEGTNG